MIASKKYDECPVREFAPEVASGISWRAAFWQQRIPPVRAESCGSPNRGSDKLKSMATSVSHAWCLTHQLPEDQSSWLGPVCPCCKQRLYTRPPQGGCISFWESQPVAYSIDGEPCFVYTLVWDDFRIRTLHPAGTDFDVRSRNAIAEIAAAETLPEKPSLES